VNFIWLDASALIKRYAAEVGTPLVNYLFSLVDPSRLLSMLEGIGEVFSALVRKRNAGTLTTFLFHQAMTNFRAEIINEPSVEKVHPTRQQVSDSWDFIEKHSLNSTDAVILRCALDKAVGLRAAGHDLVLVSADGVC
jgi:predicted nucleic acid-binding protein